MKIYRIYSAPACLETLDKVVSSGTLVLETTVKAEINKYIIALQQSPTFRMTILSDNCVAYDYGSWSKWVYVVKEENNIETI